MVNYAQLTNLDTSKLTGAAEASGGLASSLASRASEVQSAADIPAGMWAGADALAASDLLAAQPSPLFDASDVFKRGKATLDDLVADLESARERLGDAHNLVAGTGITISPDGTVTTPIVTDPAEAARNDRLAQQARTIIDEAVRQANDADDRAGKALGVGGGMQAGADAIPNKPGDTAQDVKDWWDSLDDGQKTAYIHKHPEIIGNLDGVPPEARDKANRVALNDAIGDKRQEIIDAKGKPGYGGPGSRSEQSEVKEMEADLKAMEDLRDQVSGEHSERMLLGFDPEGDGKAIVATGNPDQADNVITHVPGMGSELAGVEGEINRVDRMVSDASQLDKDSETVGVMWMDYDAPSGIGGAGTSEYARDGADDLADFQDGLRSTHHGEPSHNTVLGHSYGSTVVGHSLKSEGMNADEVVFAGSPGVGADHVSELNFDPNHVYATRAENDIIGLVQDGNTSMHIPGTDVTLSSHGMNPADPKFGAVPFESDPGDSSWYMPGGRSTAAHSQYWDSGNPARDTIAEIVTGVANPR